MTTPAPPGHAYRLTLDTLGPSYAEYTHPEDDEATLTISRTAWENLGRPGTIDTTITPTHT